MSSCLDSVSSWGRKLSWSLGWSLGGWLDGSLRVSKWESDGLLWMVIHAYACWPPSLHTIDMTQRIHNLAPVYMERERPTRVIMQKTTDDVTNLNLMINFRS